MFCKNTIPFCKQLDHELGDRVSKWSTHCTDSNATVQKRSLIYNVSQVVPNWVKQKT